MSAPDVHGYAALEPYNVSRESFERLTVYVDELLKWQQRFNLIGPSTAGEVWTRHILDAVQVVPLLPEGTRNLADLGSGAGIPGLVVAIVTGAAVHLYESNGKKAAFLRHAAQASGVEAHVHQVRLEHIAGRGEVPQVDAVLARALAPLHRLLGHAEPFLKAGALGLFHKGQDIDIELTEATRYWRLNMTKHRSVTDSRGVILEVREAERV